MMALDLAADGERPTRLQRPFLLQQRPQLAALGVAHDEVELAVDLPGVVDRNHVRMLQRSGELGLDQEAPAKARVCGERGRDQLDRDVALQAGVVCAVDHAHPTATDECLDPIPEELGPDPRVCGDRHVVPPVRVGP
jgi:hypothetical protein